MQTKTMLRKHTLLFTFILLIVNSTVLYAESSDNETPSYSVEYIVFENTLSEGATAEPWTKQAFQMPANAINLKTSQSEEFNPLKRSQLSLQAVANKLGKLSAYTPIAHGGWTQPLKENVPLKPVQVLQKNDASELTGTITFHRKKYLHLDINLQLTELDLLTNYRLKMTRRIKADDIHYFDHPRFAVLARVRKME